MTASSLNVAALHLPPVPLGAVPMPEIAQPYLDQAAARGAQLVLLPEIFAWPFFGACPPADWLHAAEPLDGPTVGWAARQATRLGVSLLVPFVQERPDGKPRNAVAFVSPARPPELVAQKIHLPPRGTARYGESDHFSPGPPIVRCVEIAGFSIAVFICFDRRFPEVWRAARAAGADMIACPVSGPADEPEDFFLTELRTHARENGLYALTAGRTGNETMPNANSFHHNAPTALVRPDGSVARVLEAEAAPGVIYDVIAAREIERARSQRPHFEMRRTIRGDTAPQEGRKECLN
ncbi:carbon-nitrogen hydrolase family protein [Pseudooceanicola sp.]|uniref:carbon-nitrogen hydrolase family protein n=1 Tax=Pseudooceanicola sp. TaxID=1914328 RepID=UPI00262882D2|nr:carbon-nitrogen hydrolase family protein [Pseudooceanicola sp.]MDF1856066.1 carbon-nitrogen hydrolase family protein [Pseudooceanicola sp.]